MRRLNAGIAVAGVAAVTAYASGAALQILVLDPRAAAPTRTLAEIHADMAAAGESPGTVAVLVSLGLGVALSILLAVLAARRPDATPRALASAFLGMVALGAPAYFVASFGPGMALADTHLISGGDHTPWGLALYAVSLVAVGGLAAIAVTSAARRASVPA